MSEPKTERQKPQKADKDNIELAVCNDPIATSEDPTSESPCNKPGTKEESDKQLA